MITCGRCQTQNLAGSQFCDECGAALHQTSGASQARPAGGPELRTGTYRLPLDSEEGTLVRPDKPPLPAQFAPPPVRNAIPSAPVPLPPPEASPLPVRAEPLPAASGTPPRHVETSAMSSPVLPVEPVPVAATRNGVHAKLVIERGRSAGKQFPLQNEDATIGRWDADGGIFPDVDLDADDPEAKISRRHARILRRSGQYYVEDLGSTNGTFINRGRRLLPGDRHPLNDGDELIIGKMFLRFYLVKN